MRPVSRAFPQNENRSQIAHTRGPNKEDILDKLANLGSKYPSFTGEKTKTTSVAQSQIYWLKAKPRISKHCCKTTTQSVPTLE